MDNLIATGGQAIQFWDAPAGRLVMTYDVARGPVSTRKVDPKRGDLDVATQGETVIKINLGELHRQLRDLALEIPGFPFEANPGATSRSSGGENTTGAEHSSPGRERPAARPG